MSLKKWLLKKAANYLILESSKPIKTEDLNYIGVDSEGKRYYTWETLTDIPRNRYLEIERINVYIDNKISKNSLAQLSHAIDKTNHMLIKEKDQDKRITLHAQITALTNEIRFRDQYAIPKEVFISLASIICVREDEDPNKFSTTIQTEKTITFEKELDNGNAFFLKSPLSKELLPSLVMSEEAWSNHLGRLVIQETVEKQRLKTILSESESTNTESQKTS